MNKPNSNMHQIQNGTVEIGSVKCVVLDDVERIGNTSKEFLVEGNYGLEIPDIFNSPQQYKI